MKYKIIFSYDGSCFNGLERQKNLKTIQGNLEEILTDINNKKLVNVFCSGRTDKGVHANNQVAHFSLDVAVKPYNLKKALNKRLSGEIYIKTLEEVPKEFHARYDVTSKTYSYYINTKEYNPMLRNYIFQLNHSLDINKMKDASKLLLGQHDFRSLCYQEKEQLNCVRTINSIKITEKDGIIKITINGNGFLRKMVRNIVSLLIKIGEDKLTKEALQEILTKKEKNYHIKCVSACGLYLDEVMYN